MTALVPIEQREVGGELIQTVDARELWEFLGVPTHFSTWITRRMEDGLFTAGQDFFTRCEKPRVGRPSTEYAVTLEVAKHLAMMEKTARGKQARQYFIEMER